jgi:hypothetical protein
LINMEMMAVVAALMGTGVAVVVVVLAQLAATALNHQQDSLAQRVGQVALVSTQ